MINMLRALGIAFSMYSIIPMPRTEWTKENMAWAMVWFPFVGLVSGAVLFGWYHLALFLGLHPIVFAALALPLTILVSGGIHLDGFCDSVDAMASRRDCETRLKIMKDPHIGPFALFITVFLLLTQFAYYVQLQSVGGSWRLWLLIALTFVLERSLSGLSLVIFPKARPDGLARTFADPAARGVGPVMIVEAALVSALMIVLGGWPGVAIIACLWIWFLIYRWFSVKQYGGMTGDLAGFFLTASEWLALLILVICSGGLFKCFG